MNDSGEKTGQKYILNLYLASMNTRARFAVENIRKICAQYLKGRYELEVIDLRENPSLAVEEKVVATPMLIKRLPLPIRTFIGNMKDLDKILVGLEVKQEG